MRRSVNVIKQLLEECSDEDRDQWKSHAQTVLAAVRASHPTRRGVQGAIAAAFFENSAVPAVSAAGWALAPGGHRPDSFRFAIGKEGRVVRVLIAALQVEAGKPVRQIAEQREPFYVAQLPKRSSRVRLVTNAGKTRAAGEAHAPGAQGWSTSEFDVLAVSLQPLTRQWSDFTYKLAGALKPSASNAALVENLQPVSLDASRGWTNDLLTCLGWISSKWEDSPLPADRAV
jgi:hypothetical protein